MSQLLLSFTEPHIVQYKPILSSSLAKCIKKIIGYVSIDTAIFKVHPFRSAPMSKAKILRISAKDILKKGNWSGKFTWKKSITRKLKVLHKGSKKQFKNKYALKRGMKQKNFATYI